VDNFLLDNDLADACAVQLFTTIVRAMLLF